MVVSMTPGPYAPAGRGGLNADVISGCRSDYRIVLEHVHDDKQQDGDDRPAEDLRFFKVALACRLGRGNAGCLLVAEPFLTVVELAIDQATRLTGMSGGLRGVQFRKFAIHQFLTIGCDVRMIDFLSRDTQEKLSYVGRKSIY
ncbi:hypothetical protein WK26_20580 [Burkholderia vietnamiensis]|nr:hypothetical protein WK26_20580 [Burkholderia vietnamiensis]KVS38183.1 hypothetical protein WK35_30090 [Burkholderia vietnamiensis]